MAENLDAPCQFTMRDSMIIQIFSWRGKKAWNY